MTPEIEHQPLCNREVAHENGNLCGCEVAHEINKAVDEYKKDLIKKIEGMKMEWVGGEAMLHIQIADGYNQALQDLIKSLDI